MATSLRQIHLDNKGFAAGRCGHIDGADPEDRVRHGDPRLQLHGAGLAGGAPGKHHGGTQSSSALSAVFISRH